MKEAADAARFTLSVASAFPIYTAVARCGLGLQAIVNGDTSAASEQYENLAVVKGALAHPFLAGDRMLGLLAHTMGQLDTAVGHFEDALAFCRKAGYRPELAWTCCDYADTLLQRNEPGDREKALSLLEESLAISSELGALGGSPVLRNARPKRVAEISGDLLSPQGLGFGASILYRFFVRDSKKGVRIWTSLRLFIVAE